MFFLLFTARKPFHPLQIEYIVLHSLIMAGELPIGRAHPLQVPVVNDYRLRTNKGVERPLTNYTRWSGASEG
jgi:hypothetical protein